MTIPDNAIGYRIAAIVPCDQGYGDCSRLNTFTGDRHCDGCLGDGTRVVPTDVAVERTTVEVGVYDVAMWREVSDA